MRIAIVAAGFTPEEANQLRRAMATFRHVGTIHQLETKMVEGMVKRGYATRLRRTLLQPDKRLRRIRLSREPRGQFRQTRLYLGLAEMPPPRQLRLRFAQRPANGLLRPRPDCARRARAWGERARRGRERQRLGLHAGRPAGRGRRHAAPGPAPDRRLSRGLGGAAHRRPPLRRFRRPGPRRPAPRGAGRTGRRGCHAQPGPGPPPRPVAQPRHHRRPRLAAIRQTSRGRQPRNPAAYGAGRTRAGRLRRCGPVLEGPPAALPARQPGPRRRAKLRGSHIPPRWRPRAHRRPGAGAPAPRQRQGGVRHHRGRNRHRQRRHLGQP